MNNKNNIVDENKSDDKTYNQSVWKRFMKVYAFLLPIVVCAVYIYQAFFSYWVRIVQDLFVLFPFSIYMLSVYVSFLLIPIILFCIVTHDYIEETKAKSKRFAKSRSSNQKMTFSRICESFQRSFIGEMTYIFMFVVMLGMIPIFYDLLDTVCQLIQGVITLRKVESGWAGVIMAFMEVFLNYVLLVIIFIIFLYVLIRRVYLKRRQTAERKKLQADKRKELLEKQPHSPEQENDFEEEIRDDE